MDRVFDIKKIKQTSLGDIHPEAARYVGSRCSGYVYPAILPRGSGKTTAIINAMGEDDICISPIRYTKSKFKAKLVKDGAFYRDNGVGKLLVSDYGKMLISNRLDYNWIRAQSFKTIFVDDFLFYPDYEIDKFIQTVSHIGKIVIMLSSLRRHHGELPSILFAFEGSIYYTSIKINSNIINLPDSLFVL